MQQCSFNLFKQIFCRLVNKIESCSKGFLSFVLFKIKRKTKPELKARGEEEVKVCGSQLN